MKTALTTCLRHATRRGTLALVGLLTLATLLTGCGLSSSAPASALAANQQILQSCDSAHPPAAWVAIDGTGSSAANFIFEERMSALQSIVQRTAVCSGYLQVSVFSASSIATTILFDGSLRQPGATTNAQLQGVPHAVNSVMATIRTAYWPAASHLSPGGSDITGQYVNAAQWFGQLGGSYQRQVALLTDGVQDVGVDLSTHVLDQQQASALAQQTPMPNLSGADVMVAGLGPVTGSTPTSAMVAGLVAYYTDLCHRANAARCISVSDYQAVGQ
jgi:hypothetical protein